MFVCKFAQGPLDPAAPRRARPGGQASGGACHGACHGPAAPRVGRGAGLPLACRPTGAARVWRAPKLAGQLAKTGGAGQSIISRDSCQNRVSSAVLRGGAEFWKLQSVGLKVAPSGPFDQHA